MFEHQPSQSVLGKEALSGEYLSLLHGEGEEK